MAEENETKLKINSADPARLTDVDKNPDSYLHFQKRYDEIPRSLGYGGSLQGQAHRSAEQSKGQTR